MAGQIWRIHRQGLSGILSGTSKASLSEVEDYEPREEEVFRRIHYIREFLKLQDSSFQTMAQFSHLQNLAPSTTARGHLAVIAAPELSEDSAEKERPDFPEIITPYEAPAIKDDLSISFKNFMTYEREIVWRKQEVWAQNLKEPEVWLRELKKFAESFTLKTAVPPDLVAILNKEKQRNKREAEMREFKKFSKSFTFSLGTHSETTLL
ncbi:hypothetical protein K440DRAFT_660192 [Wilcoxina mikolae CBS 423.85]|nr:hypothetical protein K440DRAFT_660192 [Wilcoxina mikolae CBS 423.85]